MVNVSETLAESVVLQ